jgi:dGTPase
MSDSRPPQPRELVSDEDFGLLLRLSPQRPTSLDRPIEIETNGAIAFDGKLPIFTTRLRHSTINRKWKPENFYSDKSRIVFCSSFRRMMQKAQVFSLEKNTSVRNRLTHSLEVADIGRTLARQIGKKLEAKGIATPEETECIQCIVENACLLHDIGNPPFGHFGEEAIKSWFRQRGAEIFKSVSEKLPAQIHLTLPLPETPKLHDFFMFDGNPQGFRIATRLHCDVDHFGLNLTCSTLLAAVKYPNCGTIEHNAKFGKKIGVFSSESANYREICKLSSLPVGRRYFLAYVMELADDICYCLSDIADSFEKEVTASRDFKDEFREICKELGVEVKSIIPDDPIRNFGYEVSIRVARRLIDEAAEHFSSNIESYVNGTANELSENLPSGKVLKCFKTFARRFIYTNGEVQRIEIAGSRIVEGLLDHFGRLLVIPRADFAYFVERKELRKNSGLDTEWRIFNHLSKRMLRVYEHTIQNGCSDEEEWICRARLVVDYISGLTDNYALQVYQNFMGISL